MIEIKKKIAEKLAETVEGLLTADEIYSSLEYPPDPSMGDVALPCFKFAKAMRKSPVIIAKTLSESFSLEGIEKAASEGGYLNFYIASSYWEKKVSEINSLGNNWGRNNDGEGKTVVLDYSSPNVAKPFHIGHLGTTVIGHSLKKLHEFSGYKCVGVNHLGDWGTQFGKEICAFRRWGDKASVEKGGVDELVRIYVKFH